MGEKRYIKLRRALEEMGAPKKIAKTATNRTQHLIDLAIFDSFNSTEILALAYLQGINDCVEVLDGGAN